MAAFQFLRKVWQQGAGFEGCAIMRCRTQVGPPWLMINGSDDRYQILAATAVNIDPILVVAQTLNIGNILAENSGAALMWGVVSVTIKVLFCYLKQSTASRRAAHPGLPQRW